jgi:hypothetical protein
VFRPVLITVGALGVAVTTALEVVTAPYSPEVRWYSLNGPVHVAKVVAIVVLVVGLAGWARELARAGRRATALAAGAIAGGTLVGAVPYSVVEATLDGSLAPAAADAELERIYAEHAWVGVASSIALPVTVLALIALGVLVLRSRLLPSWAPLTSLAMVPVAVLAGVLNGAGWAVPHPPAWLFLGLAAYGVALTRDRVPVAV